MASELPPLPRDEPGTKAGAALSAQEQGDASEFDLLDAKRAFPGLWRLADAVGFGSKKQLWGLMAAMLVPQVVLGAAALLEERFFLGSLTKATSEGVAVGMSYLGDSMVWPFSFLVPLLVILVRHATVTSIELLRSIYQQAGAAWRRDASEAGLAAAVRQAKLILSGRGPLSSWVRRAAYIGAALFWGYNTITCGLAPLGTSKLYPYEVRGRTVADADGGPTSPTPKADRGEAFYPYRSSRVMVLAPETQANWSWLEKFKASSAKTLPAAVALPKWDCDLRHAPLSGLLARVWTLFYYAIIPLLVGQLILLVGGTVFFLSRVAEWDRSRPRKSAIPALEIKPYASDGFGGMEILATTGMSYIHAVSGLLVLVAMSFFKEGVPPAWHNYLLLGLALPIGLAIFAVPSAVVKDSIGRAKERELDAIADRLNALSATAMRADSAGKGAAAGAARTYFQVSTLTALHQRISDIPEWPFSVSAYVRIAASLGVPVVMIALEHFVEKFLTGG